MVCERAAAMHDAGTARLGTMAAVLGLDDDQVDVACNLADADVWVTNFNAPGQVVIAGSPEGVEAAGRHAKTSKEIADVLGISVRTVDTHRQNMSTKLGLSGSHSLLKFAFHNKSHL